MKSLLTALIFLFCFFIDLTGNSITQPMPYRPRNTCSLGLFGDASFLSLNYERIFLINRTLFISGKIGLGINPYLSLGGFTGPSHLYSLISIPHHLTFNIGRGLHYFEFGIGGTIDPGSYYEQNYILYPIVGYRIHPEKETGISFRIYGHPRKFDRGGQEWLLLPFGLSVGYSF